MKGVLPAYKDSFFCWFNREDGLRLRMIYENGIVLCDVNLDNRFEGYINVLHGGMIFGILDVIIWYVIFMETKKIGITKKTEMEFFKPVMCGSPYIAKGRFLRIEDRDMLATAWLEDKHGKIYARADAIYREARDVPLDHHFINKFDFSHANPEIKEYFMSLLA
jgi:acyl-coenzyme A thioesterase PaaI-like protein